MCQTVNTEFIRAGVEAAFIITKMTHDSRVPDQFVFKFIEVADVVYALPELAHKTGRDAELWRRLSARMYNIYIFSASFKL